MTSNKKNHTRDPGLVVARQPESILAEQFRTLRTNIQFSIEDESLKTLMITSARPEAGKSIVAANLATAFAIEKYRVLLVDADLRRPTVHKAYNLKNDLGLTTLLQNPELNLAESIQKAKTKNLSLLTSGPTQPNPAEYLGSSRMKKLIKNMKNEFDFIIIDTPPLLSVTDAQLVARQIDGVLFVVPMNQVNKNDLIKSEEMLELAKANVLGAVFNQVDNSNKDYYYYYEEE